MKSEIELIHEALGFDMPKEVRIKKPKPIQLTPRELQIAQLLSLEIPIKTIAADLKISDRTVERTMLNMRKKIGCQTVIGIVLYVAKHRLVSIPNYP